MKDCHFRMTNYDPDNFTLHILKLAASQLPQANDKTEILLRKQCCKKVGRFVLVQTEIDLTLSEIELLAEASKLLEYFVTLSRQSSQSPPPAPPPRAP